MIGMEVRDRDVRDPRHGSAELGEPVRDAAAAVEQETDVARLDEVSGAHAFRRERDRARSERDETHQRPTTILIRRCLTSRRLRLRRDVVQLRLGGRAAHAHADERRDAGLLHRHAVHRIAPPRWSCAGCA